MRALLSTVALAGLLASAAHAQLRPVRPGDEALLKRAPTYEEQVAAQVAARLTRLHPQVRCAPLGIPGLPSSILGGPASEVARAALRGFDPNSVVAFGPAAGVPLLAGKTLVRGRPAVYLCERFACRAPATDPSEL